MGKIDLLKDDEHLIINTSKDIMNKLQLISMKQSSYDNLFKSYINSTIEEANKFNLEKFLDLNYKLYEDEFMLISTIILNAAGKEYLDAISNQEYIYVIDYVKSVIVISKVKNEECKTCNL